MAKKKNTKPARWDSEAWNEFRDAFKVRINNQLMQPEEMKAPEMTKLLRRTNGWKMSLTELKTKPKGKDNVKK